MAVVLVTGGAGYIGSHACKALARAGHTPVCFDNFSTGWRDAARFGPIEEGDLLDQSRLAEAIAAWRPDAVMHFAALSLVGDSMSDPGRYWRVNVEGSLNLLTAMRDASVERIVFSSTAATYGEPDEGLITESAPQRPTSVYGATKLAVERMIADFGCAHGLRAAVFRYFNVAGADQDGMIGEDHRPETHLIPIVLQVAAGRRPSIQIHGADYPTRDGTCVRDYVHVEDLVDAHLLGLERLLSGGDGLTVNLGVGDGYTVREVMDRAEIITGLSIERSVGPRRPGDPASLVCDASLAARVLGWRPSRSSLDVMIADAWRWTQRGGYQR